MIDASISAGETLTEMAYIRITQHQRRDVPICPNHGVMRAYMTRGRVTYYACKDRQCPLRSKCTTQIINR